MPKVKEEKKKQKYTYDGPIYRFERCAERYVHLETLAKSFAQARNNFLFKAAREIGLDRSIGVQVSIDDRGIELIEDEYDPIDIEEEPCCDRCGRKLNDSGECVVCDLGEYEDDYPIITENLTLKDLESFGDVKSEDCYLDYNRNQYNGLTPLITAGTENFFIYWKNGDIDIHDYDIYNRLNPTEDYSDDSEVIRFILSLYVRDEIMSGVTRVLIQKPGIDLEKSSTYHNEDRLFVVPSRFVVYYNDGSIFTKHPQSSEYEVQFIFDKSQCEQVDPDIFSPDFYLFDPNLSSDFTPDALID